MIATFQRNERGAVAGMGSAYANLPEDPAYAQLTGAAEALTAEHNRLADVMKPEALPAALLNSSAGRSVIGATTVTYGALLTRKREYEAADRSARERAPSVADTSDDAEYRGLYRTLGPAEQAARITVADLRELAAIVAAPDLAGLSSDLRELAGDRFLTLNFAERVGLAGSFPAVPSVDGDLLATGVDAAAVESAARGVLKRHRERGEQSKSDELNLQSIVGYLSAAFALQPAEVLERVRP